MYDVIGEGGLVVPSSTAASWYTIKLVDVDTAALLKDYLAKVIYKDTLRLPDSLGIVALTDTITKNQILGRTFNAKVKERVINNTTIVKELPKTKVFYGVEGGDTLH